jgi:tape measure domain-containing protein
MAVSNVELRVDARQALDALRQVNSAAGQTSTATDKLKNAVNGSNNALGATRTSASQAASSLNSLVGSVSKLAAAYLGLRTAQQAVQAGIQREESSRRLTFLAQGYGEVARAQDAATRAGKQFGLSATESNQQFAQLYGRLRPLNVSLQDIEAAFVGFNTAAKVSGATSAESASALLQLTQALGSGVLRGQELNSVLEQAPGLVVALTKELGAPISEIRKLAEQGEITSEVVIRALKRAASEGADELSAAMQGPAQQVKNLQNAFEDLQVAATDDLLPAIIEAIKGLKELLISLGPIIRGLGGIAAQTLGTVADLINAATKPRAFAAAAAIRGGRLPLAGLGGISGAEELFKGTSGTGGVGLTGLKAEAADLAKLRRQPVTKVLLDLMQARLARMETPAVPTGGGGDLNLSTRQGTESKDEKKARERAEREAERAAKAAAEEQKRVAELIRDRMFEAEVLKTKSELQDKITAAETAGDAMLVARLKGTEREIEIQSRYAVELAKETNARAQQAIIYKGQVELVANQRDTQRELNELQRKANQDNFNALQKHIEQQYQLNTGVQQQLTFAESLAGTLGQSMTSAFDALITGADNWGESLKQIASGALVDIAKQLVKIFIIEQAIQGIKNFLTPFSSATPLGAGGGMIGKFGTLGPNYGIPQRAMGGSVRAGQPYLVGERGPELFMPGRSGGIAPTGSFGGGANIVVNVDAAGSSVQGNDQSGRQLGAVIGAAVQAELVKQQRPGGLLTR